MTPWEENAFGICDMSHILFGLGAICSWEPVLVTFTPAGNGAVDESLMMLLESVTFFAWYPVLF